MVLLASVIVFVASGSEDARQALVFLVIAGLLAWRRIRNRRLRLARRLVGKLRKIPEVRLVALDGMRVTVVADNAQARTYVRANAALDAVNSSMFFGDPFTMTVRDALAADDEKALLSGSGILYVRETVAATPAA